jgi:environmental stress-induced protein Ves
MENMILQKASDRKAMPWKNGRGVLYNIASDGQNWTWEISTADITSDVPFSHFPEIYRQFCVASGAGVILTIDGASVMYPRKLFCNDIRVGSKAPRSVANCDL